MPEIDFVLLKQELTRDEGLRLKPYRDSVGKLTIAIGHNLDDKGITSEIVSLMYADDIAEVLEDLDNNFNWWRKMSSNRQHVLVNMCFNMGITVLLQFKNTLKSMESGDFEQAAKGMEHSKWYGQVGPRAIRLIAKMVDG